MAKIGVSKDELLRHFDGSNGKGTFTEDSIAWLLVEYGQYPHLLCVLEPEDAKGAAEGDLSVAGPSQPESCKVYDMHSSTPWATAPHLNS